MIAPTGMRLKYAWGDRVAKFMALLYLHYFLVVMNIKSGNILIGYFSVGLGVLCTSNLLNEAKFLLFSVIALHELAF